MAVDNSSGNHLSLDTKTISIFKIYNQSIKFHAFEQRRQEQNIPYRKELRNNTHIEIRKRDYLSTNVTLQVVSYLVYERRNISLELSNRIIM